MNLGLNVEEFYTKYLEDDAEFSLEKFYINKGEKNIDVNSWKDAVGEDATYGDLKVDKVRVMNVSFQVKGNPFVKEAPTIKNFKLIEHTPEKLVMRVLNKSHGVPYCDTFGVEEEWFIVSPPGANVKCSTIRITVGAIWYKSTMMKSMINGNITKEAAAAWAAWK